MRRTVFGGFLYLSVFAILVFSQTKQLPVSEFPAVEPFKISPGSSFSASTSQPKKISGKPVNISNDLTEALEIIQKNYIGGKQLDFNELNKSSILSMLRTLDPHSGYFDAAEYQDLLNDQRSEYFGIGASIANYRQNDLVETFVVSTFPYSPASRAGLRFGDKIVAVNGEKMIGKSSAFVRDKVRGKRGTIVNVSVERADSGRIEKVEIRRNRVLSPSIPDAYLLRQNAGYIDLTQGFNYTTIDELNAAIQDLREQGMTSLILDLRDNPGGILEQAVRVAEKFIPQGEIIVSQRGRFSSDNRVWKSANRNPEKFPVVVLVNENSASASEIVAGALQDYDRALIVGEKTFGKGLVQSVINLPFGSGLTLTTSKYFTPSGRSIQRDYQFGNLYDYYNQKTVPAPNEKNGRTAKTVTGRTIYSGDGITPDENINSENYSRDQIRMLDPIFFFSRELVSGKFPEFESYRVSLPIKYGQRIRAGNFQITDKMFERFENFIKKINPQIPTELIKREKEFITKRLKFNLVTANYGTVAANQVLIENDPQVAKAVELLPRAAQLAQTAQKSRKIP